MRSERIRYTECQVTGEMGFVLSKALNKSKGDIMADTTGQLIAHDLIEHQNGITQIGSVWDELEALGGVWFVRGEMGQLGNSYYTPQKALSFDLLNLIRYVDFTRIQNKMQNYKKLRVDDYLKVEFSSIIQNLEKGNCESECDKEISDEEFKTFQDYCFYHMIVGYRKAVKRFKDIDIANWIFTQIKDNIASIDKELLWDGAEFAVSYDKRGNVYVNPINQSDY